MCPRRAPRGRPAPPRACGAGPLGRGFVVGGAGRKPPPLRAPPTSRLRGRPAVNHAQEPGGSGGIGDAAPAARWLHLLPGRGSRRAGKARGARTALPGGVSSGPVTPLTPRGLRGWERGTARPGLGGDRQVALLLKSAPVTPRGPMPGWGPRGRAGTTAGRPRPAACSLRLPSGPRALPRGRPGAASLLEPERRGSGGDPGSSGQWLFNQLLHGTCFS